jgi:hypothetical protein
LPATCWATRVAATREAAATAAESRDLFKREPEALSPSVDSGLRAP